MHYTQSTHCYATDYQNTNMNANTKMIYNSNGDSVSTTVADIEPHSVNARCEMPQSHSLRSTASLH